MRQTPGRDTVPCAQLAKWQDSRGRDWCMKCPDKTEALNAGSTGCVVAEVKCPTIPANVAVASTDDSLSTAKCDEKIRLVQDENNIAIRSKTSQLNVMRETLVRKETALNSSQTNYRMCINKNDELRQQGDTANTEILKCNAAKQMLAYHKSVAQSHHSVCQSSLNQATQEYKNATRDLTVQINSVKSSYDTCDSAFGQCRTVRDKCQTTEQMLKEELSTSIQLDLDQNGIVDTADSVDLYIAVNLPKDFGGEVLMARMQSSQSAHVPQRSPATIYNIITTKRSKFESTADEIR